MGNYHCGGGIVSKLLFNRPPMVFDPELATLIGLAESIILQQIHYWVEINRKAGKNYRAGHYWTYNSYESWGNQFTFFSLRTIKRVIVNLKGKGWLISGNFNQLKFDRTKWYRIDYERLETDVECEKCKSGTMEDTDFAQPIPETTREAPFPPENEVPLLTIVGRTLKKTKPKSPKRARL